MKKLLVANRGEIAVRIAHAAAELDIRTVAIHSRDDAAALHVRRADEAHGLEATGVAAYLDGEAIVAAARQRGCDAIHPGYGFLSESAAFAKLVGDAGIVFVGPSVETLEIFGDKTRARELAQKKGVPVLDGTPRAVTVEEARAFFSSLGEDAAVLIKAVAGGGGRGMRVVERLADLDEAYQRCGSEARQAFGNGDVYLERWMPRARHIEVQVIGDGSGAVTQLGERECSIQRRHQKLVEIAPAPSLAETLRARLAADAVRLAEAVRYANAGTFEFLVDADAGADASYAFIEANPRLQVEHTVTEEVLGIDLVRVQLQLAAGESLASLGLEQKQVPAPRGFAIEVRVNTETIDSSGATRPSGGRLSVFSPPAGFGVRTDTCGHVGYQTSPHFDSLLAKVIGSSPSPRFADAVSRTARALEEFEIEGVQTNLPFLRRLLRHPEFVANRIHTRFVEENLVLLADGEGDVTPPRALRARDSDPLAVLSYGKEEGVGGRGPGAGPEFSDGSVVLEAPMPGTIVSLAVAEGERVARGQALLVMNAMKMEHVVEAPVAGVILRLAVIEGDTVNAGQTLVAIEEQTDEGGEARVAAEVDLDLVRPDLAEVLERHGAGLDANRPAAVARRRKTGQRTARENVEDLCDPGSFVEYGGLTIAAQRQRRTVEDLIANTPADGLLAGTAQVNGEHFDAERARCVVMSYDYTVLAGTQGFLNHRKKDRMFELAGRLRAPVVFFTEGGGGRPGDTDAAGVSGLDCMAFHLFAKLSGLVPLVGINSGRCFAGNAALLGCCDVVIAARNSNIGMGGPAMIEGGGLGVFRPEEVGAMDVQVPNGVVDIAVADEAEGVRVAKQYLSYFQGSLREWDCADQRLLRSAIPENRLRVYEVRSVIEALADSGSVLELRRHFGAGMVTSLIRIEGRPVGVIANNPKHLAGAIDSPGADKATRFMQLCDAFDIPILFLCDTPGIMVGPEIEKTALVRHCSRMFVTGANLSVPFFTIILRKSYGLGAQAMGGGSHKAPLFTVSWPTGEFGGMGLEGAVKLGFRKELEKIENPDERRAAFEHMVARAYQHGKALNAASHFEVDDVIDPADSRHWLARTLHSLPPAPLRTQKKRPCVDTW